MHRDRLESSTEREKGGRRRKNGEKTQKTGEGMLKKSKKQMRKPTKDKQVQLEFSPKDENGETGARRRAKPTPVLP